MGKRKKSCQQKILEFTYLRPKFGKHLCRILKNLEEISCIINDKKRK